MDALSPAPASPVRGHRMGSGRRRGGRGRRRRYRGLRRLGRRWHRRRGGGRHGGRVVRRRCRGRVPDGRQADDDGHRAGDGLARVAVDLASRRPGSGREIDVRLPAARFRLPCVDASLQSRSGRPASNPADDVPEDRLLGRARRGGGPAEVDPRVRLCPRPMRRERAERRDQIVASQEPPHPRATLPPDRSAGPRGVSPRPLPRPGSPGAAKAC